MKLRIIRKMVPTLIAALCMAGCTLEPGHDGLPAPVNGEEITITVNIHGQQAPVTRSIDGDGGEAVVDVINLLVFENTGAGEVLAEHVQGTIIGQSTDKDDNYKVRFKAALTPNANAKTLAVVANAAAEVDAAVDSGATSKAAILAALIHPETAPTDFYWNANNGNSPSETAVAGVDYTPIPMYGEYDVTKGGTSAAGITKGMKMQGINMVRMVARIDVVNDAAGFTLTDIYIVNFNDSGYIAPAWGVGGVIQTALPETPMIPGTAGKVTGEGGALHYSYPNGIDSLTGEIFIYEAAATTGVEGTSGHTDAVCLIVAGTLDSAPNTPYYYRIDFTAGTDGNDKTPGETGFDPFDVKYMPVYRNHRYAFTIGAVNDVGYGSFDEALASLGILNNLRTELLIIDESGLNNTVFNGRNHLSLEEETTIGYAVGNTAASTCVTDYNGGWHITGIEYADPSNAGWLAAVKAGSAGDMRSAINLTATQDNVSITGRTAYVNVEAGVLSNRLKVTQTGIPAVLNVTPPAGFNYMGGTQTFTVESVATAVLAGGTTTFDMPWTAEFSEDGGQTWAPAPPQWLTMPTSGPGGPAPIEYYATAEARTDEGSITNTEDLALRAAAARGTKDSPYDLSTEGGLASMTTANCYIVNGPGHYKLPLVYGNAVRNGTDYPSSYSSTAAPASDTFLQKFLRHDDQPITGPYIYEQFTPADAIPVWMDMLELVTDVRLTDDGRYLAFEIPQRWIAQGNAIVAVRDAEGKIMWSWHIWVTPLVDMDYPATDATTNYHGISRQFMQYNLGWCTARPAITYGSGQSRPLTVRITQEVSGLEKTFEIVQASGTVAATGGSAPYWQWGRKDPMLPSDGIPSDVLAINKGKVHYSPSGFLFNNAGGPVTIGTAIRFPNLLYKPAAKRNWTTSGNFRNLWSAGNTSASYNDLSVTKTVYDPSPAGFSLPASLAFTGFASIYNTSINVFDHIRAHGGFDAGWHFYTTQDSTNETAFYSALGFHIGDSTEETGIWLVGTSGYYQTVAPASDDLNMVLSFSGTTLAPVSAAHKSYAYSVRCCRIMLN